MKNQTISDYGRYLSLTNKDFIVLFVGALLSVTSCVFYTNTGPTIVSFLISGIYILISFSLPLEQQLMMVALALPNTKALGFGGISCSIIVCAIVVLKYFSRVRNKTPILFIAITYAIYSIQFLLRFDNLKVGLVMPIKTIVNLFFFYTLASNLKIASNSFYVGFKASVALFVGIVSAFWISFNQADAETTRIAVEGNDPNTLAVEAAFAASYLCVYYYRTIFSKWIFIGLISILAGISLFSGSRMGIILMSIVVGTTIILNAKQFKRSILLIVVFGSALVAFLLSSLGQAIIEALILRNENLESTGNLSNDRFEIWSMYAKVFYSDPILWFVGLGDYTEYGLHKQAHNFLIEDISAYGIIGVSILYLAYLKIYVLQVRMSKRFCKIKQNLFTILPFLIPIIGGMTLHGLTSIVNTTMLYLGVLCMTLPKK